MCSGSEATQGTQREDEIELPAWTVVIIKRDISRLPSPSDSTPYGRDRCGPRRSCARGHPYGIYQRMLTRWLLLLTFVAAGTTGSNGAELKITQGTRTVQLSGAVFEQSDRHPCKAGVKMEYHGGTVCIHIAFIKELRSLNKKDAEVILLKGALNPSRLAFSAYSVKGKTDFGELSIPIEKIDRIEVTKVDKDDIEATADEPVDPDKPNVKVGLQDGASLLMRIHTGWYQWSDSMSFKELGGTLRVKYSLLRSVSFEGPVPSAPNAPSYEKTTSCNVTLRDGKSRSLEAVSYYTTHGRIDGVGVFFVENERLRSLEFQ